MSELRDTSISNMSVIEAKKVTGRSLYGRVPSTLLSAELEGIYGTAMLQDINGIIKLYSIYDDGADFYTEGSSGDYVPSGLKYKQAKSIINKQARFMFAKPPEFTIEVGDKATKETAQTDLQAFINLVLKKNNLNKMLIRAAKDCFIGKRIALMLNFNESGIDITAVPSLEFIYDVDDNGDLIKIVCFYTMQDSTNKSEQKIYRKKYWLENGACWFREELYDGMGVLKETLYEPTKTLFEYIPAVVIVNDGLTGDLKGCSEVEMLAEYESSYSKLANADIDAERKTMNAVKYTVDMSPESTGKSNMSVSPGAYWDLRTDSAAPEGAKGTVGTIESSMTYSQALDTTLKRIKTTMFEHLDMPDTSSEALQGIITSGKTFKALYWGLMTRCDEKMLEWQPALEFIGRAIIEGAVLYPESAKAYIKNPVPVVDFEITVNNQYPILEDESEEMGGDLKKVVAMTMSKKTFMKKWQGLTDEEAMTEIKQMAEERALLEDSFTPDPIV